MNSATDFEAQRRMGPSAIWMGDIAEPFSTSLTKCTPDFFDTGFFKMAPECRGTYASVRRTDPCGGSDQCGGGDPAGGTGLRDLAHEEGFYFRLNELRLYQTLNLLQEFEGNVTLKAPASADPKMSAQNLISNLGTRTSGNGLKPLVDFASNNATFDSCYWITEN